MITAGTRDRIARGIAEAEASGASALVLLLDTPGGLVDATLEILQDMLNAPVPVVAYVSPRGAIAASAGTFLMLGSHVAAMAPGTTCGAAMPVGYSPEDGTTEAADQKTINFLAGHIRSVARERGRPEELAERFVTENLTLEADTALEEGVVDLIAPDLPALLEALHGREVELAVGTVALDTAGAEAVLLEPSLTEKITSLVGDPQVAFILLLVGVYGLIIGFNTPGTFFPEVLGAVSLVLALYGLGLFAVNLFAGILIVLGVLLLVAEAFTPTYGVLGVGGVVSMVLGIIFLPVEPLVPLAWLARFRFMAVGIGLAFGVFLLVALNGILKLRRRRVLQGADEFNGMTALVVEALAPQGQVRIQGEIWNAVCLDRSPVAPGEKVRVSGRRGMLLEVEAESESGQE
nr:nodulation protein NfeD [Anaerotalea alkaliphila]